MGQTVYLSVVKNTATIEDLKGLNEALKKTSVAELLESYGRPDADEFIRIEDGEMTFYDREMGEYGATIEVWGCFYNTEPQVISRYVTEGEIVFHLDMEGEPDQYIKVTPNKAERVHPQF